MQISKNLFSCNTHSLFMHTFGLLLFTSSTSYALFESYDQKKAKARSLISIASIKYNQNFDEIPLYSNKESALERNLYKLGFDINYADQITNHRLQKDIDELYGAASSLRPWNPFYSMESDAAELHDELLHYAYKAERVVNSIKSNYKFIKGHKVYHLYDGLPTRCHEMACWIYNYYYTSCSSRMYALLNYEDNVCKDIRFIDSFNASDRASYPNLYNKLRLRTSEMMMSINLLKNSYEYQDALRQKRLEEERIAEMQRLARERELRAEQERIWLELCAARYALEVERYDFERQQQACCRPVCHDCQSCCENKPCYGNSQKFSDQEFAEQIRRLQLEIDALKRQSSGYRY